MPLRRALLLSLAASTAAMVYAVEPILQVADVDIIGAKHIYPDRVRFIIEVRAGKSFSANQLQLAVADDVRAIEKMGPFTGVKAELSYGEDGRTVKVTYRFTELPYVGQVRYENFNRVVRRGREWEPAPPHAPDATYDELGYFEQDKLEKLVDTKPGTYLNPLLLENDRRALLRKLQDDGHRYARVEVVTESKDDITTVIFRIDTGQEVEVGRVFFVGLPEGVTAKVFDPGVYNPAGLFNAEGRPYQADLVALDEGSIIRTMQDLGWLDAKLILTRREVTDYVRPTEERRRHGPDLAADGQYNDRIVLIYTIEPGARYKLGTVDFVGNTVATSAVIREAFAMPEGAWFKRLDLYGDPREERQGKDLAKALGAVERSRRVISNQGYARCELGVDRRLDTVNHIVNLTLHFKEGRKYKIGRLDIHGNVVTRDAVVRRALAINPGDLWNDDQVSESRRQVERTGIFSGRGDAVRPLQLVPSYPEDRPNEVDLQVNVDERPTGSLKFEFGYSSDTGIFGNIGYSERNFDFFGFLQGDSYRGAGQILTFDIFASQERRAVATSWTNPHIFDGPYELTVAASRADGQPYEWDELRLATTTSVGRRFLNNDLAIGATYGYFNLDVSDIASNAANKVEEGQFYENSTGLYQTYDRLNDRILPTSGYLLRATETTFGSPLSGSYEYSELTASADSYTPLYQGDEGGVTYFQLIGRWRTLNSLNANQEVPFYAQYRDGGSSPRHRGFGDFELSPTEINRNGQVAYTGGTVDGLFTAQVSVPVMGTNDGIRLVGFADYGNVWGKDQAISINDMRTAIGAGIRFPIQLPVSLDFAWLLDAQPGEASTQVHFGLGFTRL